MVIENSPRLDFQAIFKTGHWSPCSQEFAGAHNLLWALDSGWQLDPEVTRVTYPCRTTHSISIYRFTLRQNHNTLVMPVINTPYLLRLIVERGLQVVPVTAPECLETAGT